MVHADCVEPRATEYVLTIMGWRQEHHALFALDGGHVGYLGVRQPRGQRDEYGYAVGVTPLHRLRDQLVNLPWETL